MPFTMSWYDPALLLIEYAGFLDRNTTDDLLHAVAMILDTSPSPIHLVLDWRGALGDPADRHRCTKQVAALSYDRRGTIAAVDSDPIVSFWIDLMAKEQQHRYLACSSIEQAVLLLQRLDGQTCLLSVPNEERG